MLTVKKHGNPSDPTIFISGVIDEMVDFEMVFDPKVKSLKINCKDVSRINSAGIKSWREFFNAYRAAGGVPRFLELSPPLVASVNYLSDFISHSEIVSLCAPYICTECGKITVKSFSAEEAKQYVKTPTSRPCESCGADAEFDEIPDEYFGFLQK